MENIYTDGKYLQNNPNWNAEDSPWKASVIGALLDKTDISFHTVTEVGCGAGVVLECLSKKYKGVKSFEGYDISPQAISLASSRANDKIQFFCGDWLATAKSADLVLVIDVIEHLGDIYGFLSKLNSKGKYFVFHIPLDISCRTILKPHILLQQRKAVGHIHYFTREMLEWLLNDTGYTIINWIYTKPMLDLMQQSSLKNRIKKTLRNISFRLSKELSVKLWGGYSMMIVVTPSPHPPTP